MIKNVKALIIVIFLISCIGCNSSEKVFFEKEYDAFVETVMETYIGIPLEMEKKDNLLFVSDFSGDSLLWMFDLNTGKVKRSLPLGEGPKNFLPPIQYFFSDSTFVVHNRWHFNLRYCKMDSTNWNIVSVDESYKLSTDIDMIYPLAKDCWVASGRFPDCRFLIMDKTGKIVSRCGDYPSFMGGESSIPNFPKFMFHQSMFGFQKDSSRLVSVTGHVIELWNYSENKLVLSQRQLLSPYTYSYQEGDFWASANASKNVEKGAERIYCTDKYIYVQYNPNTNENIYKKKDFLKSEILIFNWDGLPVIKLNVDRQIICFCVDEDNSKIYCMFNNPDPSIGVLNYSI